MKPIIIGGASRSGKSTVAKAVAQRLNISYIPLDSIISTVERHFPDHAIRHMDDTLHNSRAIASFLKEFLSHLDYEDMPYVIDTYQVRPIHLVDAIDLTHYRVMYMGYPTINVEDKMQAIRQSARPHDWTETIDDTELRPIVEGFIRDSITLSEDCRIAGIPFVDTSQSFRQRIASTIDALCQTS